MAKRPIAEPNFLYYNKFEIQVETVFLKEVQRWAHKVILFRHKGSNIKKRAFTGDAIFESEKEAVKSGFLFGQEIIDGNNLKHSIKGL